MRFRSFISAVLIAVIPAQAFEFASAAADREAVDGNPGPETFQRSSSGEVVAILAFADLSTAHTFETQTVFVRRVATELERKAAEQKGRAIYKSLSPEKKEELKKRNIHYLAVKITPEKKPATKEGKAKPPSATPTPKGSPPSVSITPEKKPATKEGKAKASSTATRTPNGSPPSVTITPEKKPATKEGPAKTSSNATPTPNGLPPSSPKLASASGADLMLYGFETGTTPNNIIYTPEHKLRSGAPLKLDGIDSIYFEK